MRITVAAVGRARRGPVHELFGEWTGRLSWPVELREVEEKRRLPPAELRRREGALLLKAVPDGALVVALDAGGRALDSKAFARQLGRWRDAGTGALAFLIGGAEGLDPEIRDGASLVLSLGPMTWPHLLVRAMLAEQLWRAESILTGHPYHR